MKKFIIHREHLEILGSQAQFVYYLKHALQEKLPLRKGNMVPESSNLVPNSLLRREKAGRHPS